MPRRRRRSSTGGGGSGGGGGGGGGSERIRVVARMLPCSSKRVSPYLTVNTVENTVAYDIPADDTLIVNNSRTHYAFAFDHVFDMEATQEDVFTELAVPVAESVLDGINGTVFAYGQTGSGKTHSMTGPDQPWTERGICPRTVSYLFEQFRARVDCTYSLHLSYIEVYNNVPYDLLADGLPRLKGVSKDEDGEVLVRGASVHRAEAEEDALQLLWVGTTNRATSESKLNHQSSRSHSIFTLYVEAREPESDVVRRSKLHLVDLAGSERLKTTDAQGRLRREATHINQSLHFLEVVINALRERQGPAGRSHIPYRNTTLTAMLQDSLGGNCKTAMLATLNSKRQFADESISTGRFAQRVAQIQNTAVVNERVDPMVLIQQLKEENARLKADESAGSAALSPDEMADMRRRVREFLEASGPARLTLPRKRRVPLMHFCFNLLKESAGGGSSSSSSSSVAGGGGSAEVAHLQAELQERVAELQSQTCWRCRCELGGAAPGPAPPAPAPVRGRAQAAAPPPAPAPAPAPPTDEPEHLAKMRARLQRQPELLSDPHEALQAWVRLHPSRDRLEAATRELQDEREAAKALIARVNRARADIEALKGDVERVRMHAALAGLDGSGSGSASAAAAADGDEAEYVRRIDEAKAAYKDAFAQLQRRKRAIEGMQGALRRGKEAVRAEFDEWWASVGVGSAGPPPPAGAAAAVAVAVAAARDELRAEAKRASPRGDDDKPRLQAAKLQEAKGTGKDAFLAEYPLAEEHERRRGLLKRMYREARELSEQITAARAEVVRCRDEAERCEREGDAAGAEHWAAVSQREKAVYKETFGELKQLKGRIERAQAAVEEDGAREAEHYAQWRCM